MILVQCLTNSGGTLSNSELSAGYTRATQFGLKIGQTYLVHGIIFWKGVVAYLLESQELSPPAWFPASLFDVVENDLPPDWAFAHWGVDVEVVIGYKKLALDRSHYDALAECDPEAVSIFREQKANLSEP